MARINNLDSYEYRPTNPTSQNNYKRTAQSREEIIR